MTTRSVRILFAFVLLVAIGQQAAVAAPGENESVDEQSSPRREQAIDDAKDGAAATQGTGEVGRAGNEQPKPSQEQAVDAARNGVGTSSGTVEVDRAANRRSRPRPEQAVDEKQRQQYTQALAALHVGDLARFQKLRDGLSGYALQPFLDYEFLKDHITTTPVSRLHDFLERNPEAVVSDQLRRKWLKLLSERGDWDTFIAEFRDIEPDNELNCQRLAYLIKVSQEQSGLMAEAGKLWLTGSRLPAACEPVFEAWRKAGHMTSDMVWARIQIAMEKRNLTLAESLGRYLEPSERVWVQRWLAMHRQPQQELLHLRYPVETPVARHIIRHGVVRLAYTDPDEAMRLWQMLKERYEFFGEDDKYVLRWVGILAAQAHHPRAVEWLSAASADVDDEALRQWRVRAAIRSGEWQTGLRFLALLPETEQKEGEWRYWKARMLERTGEEKQAKILYRELAKERSYYGFLAADRIGQPYAMQHVSVQASPEEVSTTLARPGIQMAKELFTLGDTVAARRQWTWITRQMNNRDLAVAAVLARHWGWYDRAILTVSKSDHLDDLELRFPVLYRDMVEANAQRNNIDPDWVYGVLRQESAFVSDARSEAGALGLMQLMPRTGQLTGRRINLRLPNNTAILNVENNLKLGASYLRTVLDVNHGHQVLATASYNAGPNRVREWLPDDKPLDADVWVDTVPYNETRNYVKNVMAFTTVYGYRLEAALRRLQERMPSVLPGGMVDMPDPGTTP
jgi:soluble lytic murein transglycosylase